MLPDEEKCSLAIVHVDYRNSQIFVNYFFFLSSSTITWFFVLKLLEQSSAHKSHVILSNLQGSEPSFEHEPLGMSYFPKPVEIRNLFLFILTFEETF